MTKRELESLLKKINEGYHAINRVNSLYEESEDFDEEYGVGDLVACNEHIEVLMDFLKNKINARIKID